MSVNRRQFLGYSAGSMGLGALGASPLRAQTNSLVTKPIPKTGEHMPLIGIGTNQYGVGASEEERAPLKASLKKFSELGGKLIDTAPSYRKSQAVLGDLIAELGVTDDLLMATKCDQSSRDDSVAQIQESHSLLGFDVIDFMQIHNMKGWQVQLPILRELQQEGKIRYYGITTSRAREYGAFMDIMRSEPMDTIQVNYSLADRGAEKEILPLAQEKGLAVIVNLPFGRGALFSAVQGVDLPEWASEFDCQSWAQFFLKYIVSHPAVNTAIPGTTKEKYAIDNIGASMGALPDAAMRKRQEDFFDNL